MNDIQEKIRSLSAMLLVAVTAMLNKNKDATFAVSAIPCDEIGVSDMSVKVLQDKPTSSLMTVTRSFSDMLRKASDGSLIFEGHSEEYEFCMVYVLYTDNLGSAVMAFYTMPNCKYGEIG